MTMTNKVAGRVDRGNDWVDKCNDCHNKEFCERYECTKPTPTESFIQTLTKILEAIDKNPDCIKNGLFGLEANGWILFGKDLNYSGIYYNDKVVSRIFKLLMGFEVPPSDVELHEYFYKLTWLPTHKLIFNNNHDLVRFYMQFNDFIESQKDFHMSLDLSNIGQEYDGSSKSVITSPGSFMQQEFVNNSIHFWNMERNSQFSLKYDSNGKIRQGRKSFISLDRDEKAMHIKNLAETLDVNLKSLSNIYDDGSEIKKYLNRINSEPVIYLPN